MQISFWVLRLISDAAADFGPAIKAAALALPLYAARSIQMKR